ncbi:MAG: hypothetical protein KDC05_04970 [Bacteroidales bacterium]|nr:hypothetical protein [Bacteroidales bacterium]
MKTLKTLTILIFMMGLSIHGFSQINPVSTVCPAPSDAYVADVQTSQATFFWQPDKFTSEWTIEIGPEGFTPGNGTALKTLDVRVARVTPLLAEKITGLSSSTYYSVFIKTECDGSGSKWVGPVIFKTR